jgi:hypothetical protein
MRKSLLKLSLFSGAILLACTLTAQQVDRFAYAVTDVQQGGANWSFLRKINLQNGEYSQVLLSGNDASLLAYNATTRKQFEAPLQDARFGTYINAAFASGVAAMAYDKKNSRLYYTPMFIDQLRFIDLKSMKVYYVTDQVFTGKPQKSSDQGNIVTRMVIASDGFGYAMTNDATQLIKFSTGKKLSITDLGTIADDQSNKGVSIHNSCSSYGGDMIADDAGCLYVFSARNQVFKINTETKVATHLGTITGLPNGFTVNGAAVNDENKVLVSSAMLASSYYTIDMKSLVATPFTINGTVWQSSDLANGNLLNTGTQAKGNTMELLRPNNLPNSGEGKIAIYPNPVTNNQFAIQFNELAAGQYTIQVTDVMGRQVLQQIVNLGGDNQTQQVKLNASSSKGIYLVKVTDNSNRAVYNSKIVVQ